MGGNIELSYDIFEWFPIGVCQDVFSYLRGEVIIEASAVNKEWNKLCAEKRQVKKLKLVLSDSNQHMLTDDSVVMLRDSRREYDSIEFRNISFTDSRHFLTILQDRAGSWKSVNLNRCLRLDHDPDTLNGVFRVIEPTVQTFTITRHATTEYGTPDQIEWTFPRLRVLESDFGRFLKYFYGCTSLVKLDFTSYMDNGLGSEVRNLMRNNRGLKELSLIAFGSQFVEPFEFQLERLSIMNAKQTSLYSFLETQAQSLVSLEIHVQLNNSLLKLILTGMPRLASLTSVFQRLPIISDSQPINTTITTLDLQGRREDAQDGTLYETLIRSLGNLKNFRSLEINGTLLDFLAREVPALESIETRFFNVHRIPDCDIFPNIKELKVGAFIGHMQEPTGCGNFAALVRMEMKG